MFEDGHQLLAVVGVLDRSWSNFHSNIVTIVSDDHTQTQTHKTNSQFLEGKEKREKKNTTSVFTYKVHLINLKQIIKSDQSLASVIKNRKNLPVVFN